MSFDRKIYLENRPDLKKNWGTPFRANFHYHLLSPVDRFTSSIKNKYRNIGIYYPENRPDLKKNWGTPFRANFHYHVMRRYDLWIHPYVSFFPSKKWKEISKEKKSKLLSKYSDFKSELKQTPDIFDHNPSIIKTVPMEKKEYVLIINLYNETNTKRSVEFIKCLDINIKHNRICKIIVFYDSNCEDKNDEFLKKIKERNIEIVYKKGRLNYKYVFEYTNKHFPLSNIIVSNADIYFNKTLKKLDPVNLHHHFVCLTRWNVGIQNKLKIFYQQDKSHYSSDTWIFKTPLEIDFRCDLEMGINHCDSFLNYHLLNSSYKNKVINPCLDIQVCHLHKTEYRNYKSIPCNSGIYVNRNLESQGKISQCGIKWSYL